MTPIILKRSVDADLQLLAAVDATVAWLFLALSWVCAGWLGYVILDSRSTAATRLAMLGIVAVQQLAALAIATRARREARPSS